MRLSLLSLILACPFFAFCQIDFTISNPDPRAVRADSAIRAGEFGDVHSLVVVKKGKLVFESYYAGWHRDSLHQLQSATKSVVATLFGCAIQNGFVKSAGEKIANYYSTNKKITVADLMTQRHGLRWKESPWNDPDNTWRKVLSTDGDWYEMILQTPTDTTPGTKFNYSNAAPVLTTGVIQKASGMRIDSFAHRYLFEPLGIDDVWFWPGNGGPQNNGMALISLRPRDMAKIGQLYLQGGMWKGKRILPNEFIAEATSPIVVNAEGNSLFESYDYGYFWWVNPKVYGGNPESVYLARGAGGQVILVSPADETVMVITAWNMTRPAKPQMIWDRYLSPNSPGR